MAMYVCPSYPVSNIVNAGVRLGRLLKSPPAYRPFFVAAGLLGRLVKHHASQLVGSIGFLVSYN